MNPVRLLIVTAVDAERDAVGRGLSPAAPVAAPGPPGRELLRLTCNGGVPCPDTHPMPSAARRRPLTVDLLTGGVGPAAAAAATGAALALAAVRDEPYDLVVSAGIAGGFAPVAAVGSVVVADRVIAADLGCETADGFLPVDSLGFGTSEYACPPHLAAAVARVLGAVHAPVLTVSTVTGTEERARMLQKSHGAAAEAMEGFGVAEAAAVHGTPILEVRTVSNPVGPRDRAAWRIPDALAALRDAFAVLRPVLAHGAPPPYS
ncbi:futalosine hydrolase [Streptomyces hirsutus]|uniref:Futalosine hydrolase n=1 Tax=Streptomyces hirsutus TaxID=35620 RepID=A0ABZ1GWU2_9ACTN|nr:futalosine hydrolase [Streptomyces hirsutus]WSD10385.1 futalosine hydrolase [Streptomyces hirsutus]WTD78960.1 futalosine hydrolase [Streptomyces sp. NBC_01635]